MNLLKRGSAGSPKSSEAPVPERTGIVTKAGEEEEEEEGSAEGAVWEVGDAVLRLFIKSACRLSASHMCFRKPDPQLIRAGPS